MLKGAGTRGVPEIPAGSSYEDTYSLDFDGADDYVNTNNYDIDATNGLTLSCWVKSSGFATWDYLCSRATTGGVDSQFNLRFSASGGLFSSFVGGSYYTGLGGFGDGNWHHIAMTVNYSTGDVTFYKNNVVSATVLTFGATYSNAILGRIGDAAGSNFMKGIINEFAIFESIQNISTLWNGGVPGDLTSLSPTIWYQFNEGSGTTAIDSGTAGNNGTISGATYTTDVPS